MWRKRIIQLATVFSVTAVLPLIAVAKAGVLFKREGAFVACGQLLSLVPGRIGVFFRRGFYMFTLRRFSANAHIDFGSYFSKSGAAVGDRVWIGGNSVVGYATIGDDSVIGSRVSVISGKRQHNFADPRRKILDGTGEYSCVTIGENVFVGEQSLVMADVGSKSIVGAGSVVVKAIPAFSVAVGNPARVIKSRYPLSVIRPKERQRGRHQKYGRSLLQY